MRRPMRRQPLAALLTLAALAAAAGCAGSFAAAGPGGSGIKRKGSDSVVITHTSTVGNTTYGYGYVVPGKIHVAGGGLGVSLGAKLGAAWGAFGERERIPGIHGEPHLDLVWLSRGDRFSFTATVGWLAQSFWYDADRVGFSGLAPSLSVHYGLRRRLYVHAGAGYTLFGSLATSPDDEALEMQRASTNQARLLGGLSWVFRRTPRLDIVFRLEGSAYRTGEVTLGAETGTLTGVDVTFEAIWSTF